MGSKSSFLIIGSAGDCDVVVNGAGVLARHARLERMPAGWEIVRLEAGGTVSVNGVQVEHAAVSDGDTVRLGEIDFRFANGVLLQVEQSGELDANGLVVALEDGRRILDEVGFLLEPSSMLAIVGPSGAGKSTLLNALTGFVPADEGSVTVGGRNLYAEFDELRSSIGLVPQHEVLHDQLGVRVALRYAAALRFPMEVGADEQARRVDEVIGELGLADRFDTRIAALSGGQRKRVSVALELLTKPELLFLDEPTSGLDPGNERELMKLLRELAANGRIVVVVTHSTQSLDLCDRVLFLAPGGKLAYYGPPAEVLPYFGESAAAGGYAGLFDALEDGSSVDWKGQFEADQRYARYVRPTAPADRPPPRPAAPPPPPQPPSRQLRVLARRNLALIAAERRTVLFLVLQAPALAALFVLIYHSSVFTTRHGFSGVQLLWLLVIGVTWMGLASTILEIVKEAPIYRRERGVGLSIGAYIGSKAIVLGAITAAQVVVLTWLVLLFQNMPPRDDLCSETAAGQRECYLDALGAYGLDFHRLGTGAVLSSASLELTIDLVLVGLAAAMLGLLVSALVRSSDQALRLLPVVLAAQIVFSLPGSVGRTVDVLGVPVSARWGTAATASTMGAVELQTPYYTANATGLFALKGFIGEYATGTDEQTRQLFARDFRAGVARARLFGWAHEGAVWFGDVAMLVVLGVAALGGTWVAMRRRDAAILGRRERGQATAAHGSSFAARRTEVV